MSIKNLTEKSYISGPVEFEVMNGDEAIKLYAHEISYFKQSELYANAIARAKTEGRSTYNALLEIAVESIADADGNKFTLDQMNRLRAPVARVILDKVMEVNGLDKSTDQETELKN